METSPFHLNEPVLIPRASGLKAFSPPVRRAIAELSSRVGVLVNGRLALDGRPSDPRQLVREANRIRHRIGLSAIRYPGENL